MNPGPQTLITGQIQSQIYLGETAKKTGVARAQRPLAHVMSRDILSIVVGLSESQVVLSHSVHCLSMPFAVFFWRIHPVHWRLAVCPALSQCNQPVSFSSYHDVLNNMFFR